MKKIYIIPKTKAHNLQAFQLLAASGDPDVVVDDPNGDGFNKPVTETDEELDMG